jgi:hypothetical protein
MPKTRKKTRRRPSRLLGRAKSPLGAAALVIVVGIVIAGGYLLVRPGHAATCTVNAIMVNSCRAWIGAAVGGNLGTPDNKITDFTNLESELGRKLDLFHDYHNPGSLPLNDPETFFANRANTMDYINYKPAGTWAAAGGGNASVNADIKQAADNVKANGHKMFITIWHEPENDVSAFDNPTQQSQCTSNQYFNALKGSAGTPSQYRAMWTNVQRIFNNEGANNVVWVMNYMNYRPWECLVPMLWPGNTAGTTVDWVTFEAYAGTAPTWKSKIDDMYNTLLADTDANHDFTSHPWGLGEIGDCSDDHTTAAGMYQELKSDFDNNDFPRLKLVMFFDSANGPGGTSGCLVDKGADELAAAKALANDPYFTNSSPSPTPSPAPTPKIGDLNGDGVVDVFDLSILLSEWGTQNATADLNKDGTVNVFDLSILLSHWG